TFGPTFRAENSNTPRHAAEFWMVEPEMAFADLEENMDLAEELITFCIRHIRQECARDLELFTRFVDKSLHETLDLVTAGPFVRLPYAQAIDILQQASQKKKFEYEPAYGADLQTEHERYLVETHFQRPVIVHDYPRSIKPFYMRQNDDQETVAAMDVLVPRVGELVGGSQREERLQVLAARMRDMGLDEEEYSWYLDLRRYGTVPHSGFGLGFERLLMFITGVHNIRDVLPFPRTPKNLQF
ncbi:MAG: asparagine--tRNA ligase, partial [Desulfovermiculus sp.]